LRGDGGLGRRKKVKSENRRAHFLCVSRFLPFHTRPNKESHFPYTLAHACIYKHTKQALIVTILIALGRKREKKKLKKVEQKVHDTVNQYGEWTPFEEVI
jgi:hypothetical protein